MAETDETQVFIQCRDGEGCRPGDFKLVSKEDVTPGDIEVFPMSSMTPIHTTEQLKAQQARAHGGAFLSLAKVAGTADIYRMYTIAGSTPNGRQKITASATAAGAKHIRDKKTTCAVMADTSRKCVSMTDDLAPGRLYAHNAHIASATAALQAAGASAAAAVTAVETAVNYPWPQAMQRILSKTGNTISEADVSSCCIKGALRYHIDDHVDYKEEMTYVVNNKTYHMRDIGPEDSELCGLWHDVLRQMDGHLPDNYHSTEEREQVLVSRDMEHLSEVIIFMVVRIKSIPKRKQVWDAVRGAAARGMILGLDSAWASSTWVDSQGRLQEGQQPSDGDVGMPAAAAAAPKAPKGFDPSLEAAAAQQDSEGEWPISDDCDVKDDDGDYMPGQEAAVAKRASTRGGSSKKPNKTAKSSSSSKAAKQGSQRGVQKPAKPAAKPAAKRAAGYPAAAEPAAEFFAAAAPAPAKPAAEPAAKRATGKRAAGNPAAAKPAAKRAKGKRAAGNPVAAEPAGLYVNHDSELCGPGPELVQLVLRTLAARDDSGCAAAAADEVCAEATAEAMLSLASG